jgi:hypothetical protein
MHVSLHQRGMITPPVIGGSGGVQVRACPCRSVESTVGLVSVTSRLVPCVEHLTDFSVSRVFLCSHHHTETPSSLTLVHSYIKIKHRKSRDRRFDAV